MAKIHIITDQPVSRKIANQNIYYHSTMYRSVDEAKMAARRRWNQLPENERITRVIKVWAVADKLDDIQNAHERGELVFKISRHEANIERMRKMRDYCLSEHLKTVHDRYYDKPDDFDGTSQEYADSMKELGLMYDIVVNRIEAEEADK